MGVLSGITESQARLATNPSPATRTFFAHLRVQQLVNKKVLPGDQKWVPKRLAKLASTFRSSTVSVKLT